MASFYALRLMAEKLDCSPEYLETGVEVVTIPASEAKAMQDVLMEVVQQITDPAMRSSLRSVSCRIGGQEQAEVVGHA